MHQGSILRAATLLQLVIIMEAQVKGTMRYYYTSPQWLKLKRLKKPSFGEDVNSQNSETLLEEYKMAQPLRTDFLAILIKLNRHVSYDLEIYFLDREIITHVH